MPVGKLTRSLQSLQLFGVWSVGATSIVAATLPVPPYDAVDDKAHTTARAAAFMVCSSQSFRKLVVFSIS